MMRRSLLKSRLGAVPSLRTLLATQLPLQASIAGVRKFSALNEVGNETIMSTRNRRQGVSGVVATVFGATGFFGRYVVFKLGPIGSQVICPYRGDGEDARHLKLAGDIGQVVPVPGSLLYEDDIRKAVAHSNVVINLVGSNHETNNYTFDDANVKCVYRIAKICSEFPNIQRFIHVSGLGADENSKSSWARSKGVGEKVVREFFPNATIMRPAAMWGKEDKLLGKIADVANWSPFLPTFHGGKQKIQPVAANDVGQAIMSALASTDSAGKTYELGGPEIFHYEDLAKMVCDEIYQHPNLLDIPEPVARVMGRLQAKFPKRWQLFTEDNVDRMSEDSIVSNKKGTLTFKDLMIEPSPLKEDIAHLLLRHRGVRGPDRVMGFMGRPSKHQGDSAPSTQALQAGVKGHGFDGRGQQF